MNDRWPERLSEYLDGELAGAEREELERHLFACSSCATLLAQLRQVAERARTLQDRAPAHDLWPEIARRIGAEDPAAPPVVPLRPVRRLRFPGLRGRPSSLAFPQLAAATVALLVAGAATVWIVQRTPAPPAGLAPTAAERRPPDVATGRLPAAGSPAAPSVREDGRSDEGVGAGRLVGAPGGSGSSSPGGGLVGPRYDEAVAELERALEEGRGKLDPATLRALEKNLALIDSAIEDARRALETDPGNAYVGGHLGATLRRKAELLRRANVLVTSRT